MADAQPPWLVGDIGGTNARFALVEPAAEGKPCQPGLRHMRALKTADFASLVEAVRHYLADCQEHPSRAALAVAGPVRDEDIGLTNSGWSFRRDELAAALDLHELKVLNDFGAAAMGVSALGPDDFELLQGGPDEALEDPISVIGPGTGMGMALLLRDAHRQWQVVETEGGHASFAPQDAEEHRIHDWLTARHGRVSIERVLCGRGLSETHAALTGLSPARANTPAGALRAPADIVAAALSGEDDEARAALSRFCAILGSVAGDAVLFHGARTLAMTGGMVPRFPSFLKSSQFSERFQAKGRFAAYLQSVAVVLVTHPAPGLLGAAVSLAEVHCREPTDFVNRNQ